VVTRKSGSDDDRDHEIDLSSRIAKLTSSTLDAATDFFKAGESGFKQIFSPKKTLKRQNQPSRVVRKPSGDVSMPPAAPVVSSSIAELEKKLEIEKIINLKKIADLEQVIKHVSHEAADLAAQLGKRIGTESSSAFDRISDMEKKLFARVSEEIEKRVAGIAAALPVPDDKLTERILLQRIAELESRIERENRDIHAKLSELECHVAAEVTGPPSSDTLQEKVASLERAIAGEGVITTRLLHDLEERLVNESRILQDKLSALETSMSMNGASGVSFDHVESVIAELERKIEAECTLTTEKMSDLASRLEYENGCIRETLAGVEKKHGALVDTVQTGIAELETRIEAEGIITGQKLSELERRLDRDSRSILEKMIRLDNRVNAELETVAQPESHSDDNEKIADLENRIEQERRNNLEKRLDLIKLIDAEKSSGVVKITSLENRLVTLDGRVLALENKGPHSFKFAAESATAEKSKAAATRLEQRQPADVEAEGHKPDSIKTLSASTRKIMNNVQVSSGEPHASEETAVPKNTVRTVPVLGKMNVLAGLATANKSYTLENRPAGTKKTKGVSLHERHT